MVEHTHASIDHLEYYQYSHHTDLLSRFPKGFFMIGEEQTLYAYQATVPFIHGDKGSKLEITIKTVDPDFVCDPLLTRRVGRIKEVRAPFQQAVPILFYPETTATPPLLVTFRDPAKPQTARDESNLLHTLPGLLLKDRPQLLTASWARTIHQAAHQIVGQLPIDDIIRDKNNYGWQISNVMLAAMKHLGTQLNDQLNTDEFINSHFTFTRSEQGILVENHSFIAAFYTEFFALIFRQIRAQYGETHLTKELLDSLDWNSVYESILQLGVGENGALAISTRDLWMEDFVVTKNQDNQYHIDIAKERKAFIQENVRKQQSKSEQLQLFYDSLIPWRDRVHISSTTTIGPGLTYGVQRHCPVLPGHTVPDGMDHAYLVLTEIAKETLYKTVAQRTGDPETL